MGPLLVKSAQVSANRPMKEQVEIQQFKTSEYWNKDQDISTQVQVSLLNHLHHLGNYTKP